ncbi:hypothetical protein ACFPRL_20995 [Pseudoclavibacter helvolus]
MVARTATWMRSPRVPASNVTASASATVICPASTPKGRLPCCRSWMARSVRASSTTRRMSRCAVLTTPPSSIAVRHSRSLRTATGSGSPSPCSPQFRRNKPDSVRAAQ